MATNIRTITAEELKGKMGKNNGLTVINALDKETYDDCRITGSINIPLNVLKDRVKDWDRNKEIVTYCAQETCPVSREAFEILASMGFTNIYAYEGGMREWKQKGFPSQGACKAGYLTE
jgi:rhodanese-related sulfurtransferase